MKTTTAALAALSVVLLFGIAGTPDYVLEVERENDALRARLAKAQNAQLQCRETLVAMSGVSE
jgi:hypothetical protein